MSPTTSSERIRSATAPESFWHVVSVNAQRPVAKPAMDVRVQAYTADALARDLQRPDEVFAVHDAEGSEYRCTFEGDGVCIVDCTCAVSALVVPQMLLGRPVVSIGEEAFKSSSMIAWTPGRKGVDANSVPPFALGAKTRRNSCLKRVVLPEGLRRIGRAAFRGCNNLAEVVLPESLEEIDELAFSCTALRGVRIPGACVRLADRALRTGPETVAGIESPYQSTLEFLEVDESNAALQMCGPVLCARPRSRGEGGSLEALYCPRVADEVDLSQNVGRIAQTTFAGTFCIGSLTLSDTVRFASKDAPFANSTCSRLTLKRETSSRDGEEGLLVLDMPDRAFFQQVVRASYSDGRIDANALAAAYDEAFLALDCNLDSARLMLTRVANPVLMAREVQELFRMRLSSVLDNLIAHFGARAEWHFYDKLVEVGLLTEANVPRALDVLTTLADTASVGYLLDLQRTRLRKDVWDYGL